MSLHHMDDEDLDDLHWRIIKLLRDGRATPSYLADETGESRQLVSQRLRDLRMGDYVTKVHKGLYELDADPEGKTPIPAEQAATVRRNLETAREDLERGAYDEVARRIDDALNALDE